MKIYRADDMTALHTKMAQSFVDSTRDRFDIVTQADCAYSDVMAKADSMEFNWNVKDLWLTRMRWNAIVKQYLDPEATWAFIRQAVDMVGHRGRGTAVLRTKVVKPRGGFGFSSVTRKWGSCMLSVTFKARPRPQITLHSRTSYLGYLGALDMNVAWNLGRYIAAEIGLDMADIQFVWFNETMQWHYFKSMAYMLNHPDPDEQAFFRFALPEEDDSAFDPDDLAMFTKASPEGHPVMYGARTWLTKILASDKIGKTYGEDTYNTYRRVRRRYHREILGLEYAKQFEGFYYPRAHAKEQRPTFYKAYPALPNCYTNTLDLSPIKLVLTDGPSGKTQYVEAIEEETPENPDALEDLEDIGDVVNEVA